MAEGLPSIPREEADSKLERFVRFEDESAREKTFFDGGSFYLYLNPNGWNVITDSIQPRFPPWRQLSPKEKVVARHIAEFRAHEPEKWRVGEGFRARWGVRGIRIDEDTVHLDGVLSTFPTYKAFSSPEMLQPALRYANPIATCTTVETPTHIVLARRSILNDPYGGDIGLVGGYHDQTNVGHTNGLPKPLDNSDLEETIKEELEHELELEKNEMAVGLPSKITTSVLEQNLRLRLADELSLRGNTITIGRPNGIAIDREKIHTEATYNTYTTIDPEEITLRAFRTTPRDFSEKIVAFPKSEEAYTWLLTECMNPIPETHKANIVASGFAFLTATKGEDYAHTWLKRMEKGLQDLKKRQDEAVKEYYRLNPEDAFKQRGKNPPRNTQGYDANYLPEEQGLPRIDESLNQAAEKGLVPPERAVSSIAIFDLDGVIANTETRQVDKEQLLQDIATMLERDEFIGFNTGRSIEWVKSTILDKLEPLVQDKAKLHNLIVVGEVGSAWLRYDENGEAHESIDETLALPHMDHPSDPNRNIWDDITSVFDKYAGTMFIDQSKQAMFTAEQNVETPSVAFKKDQADVKNEIEELLTEYGLNKDFEVDATTIATDVKNKLQGKHLGVQRIFNLMRYRRITPQLVETYGDSASDIKMAQEAMRQGYSTRFIATNSDLETKFTPEDTAGIEMVYTTAQLDAGTEEYLDKKLERSQ